MPRDANKSIPIMSPPEIRAQLRHVQMLVGQREAKAALLLAWSAFEAVARWALSDRFAGPVPAGTILETIAFEGFVSPSEADRIRPLVMKRNRIAHGDFSVCVSDSEVEEFLAAIEGVLHVAETPEPAST